MLAPAIGETNNNAKIHRRFIRPELVPVQYGGLSRAGDLENGPPKPASEFTIKGGEKVFLEIDGIEVRAPNFRLSFVLFFFCIGNSRRRHFLRFCCHLCNFASLVQICVPRYKQIHIHSGRKETTRIPGSLSPAIRRIANFGG